MTDDWYEDEEYCHCDEICLRCGRRKGPKTIVQAGGDIFARIR
jgi:hypothetical protein